MSESISSRDGRSQHFKAIDRQPRNEHSLQRGVSDQPLQHHGRRTQDQKRKASDTTRTDTSSNLNTRANSAPFRNSASGMGRQAVSHDSTRSCKCEKIPISTPAVEGEGESEPEEEFKINTEWSANPTWQTANASAAAKSSQPKTQRSGRASTMLNDAEAGKCGPLMKATLEKERRRSKHDPSHQGAPCAFCQASRSRVAAPSPKPFENVLWKITHLSNWLLIPNSQARTAGNDMNDANLLPRCENGMGRQAGLQDSTRSRECEKNPTSTPAEESRLCTSLQPRQRPDFEQHKSRRREQL